MSLYILNNKNGLYSCLGVVVNEKGQFYFIPRKGSNREDSLNSYPGARLYCFLNSIKKIALGRIELPTRSTKLCALPLSYNATNPIIFILSLS